MPPKRETTDLYIGTADGEILGKLGDVKELDIEFNDTEPCPFADGTPSLREFRLYLRTLTNNYRKMHGIPLRRGIVGDPLWPYALRMGIYKRWDRRKLRNHKKIDVYALLEQVEPLL